MSLQLLQAVKAGENNPPPDQILDNSGRGGLATPPVLKGPLPSNKEGLPTPQVINQAETPQAKAAADKLDNLVEENIRSMGAMFVDPEQVIVSPPLLSALIRVDEVLNPYSLEASGSRAISLHDVLNAAQGQNLNIKTLGADSDVRRWNMISSIGGFLPTLTNEITYQGISGNYISPASAAIPIQNYYLNTSNSFTQYLYKGGSIIHTYLEEKHNYLASKHAVKLVSNDTMLETAKLYYQLALNEVMLQIRIKTVETAEGLLLINKDLYANGVNTMLEVLQAKTQLSRDRQQLIKQQMERRQAAVKLATTINEDAGVDLTLGNPHIGKLRLIDKRLNIKDLLQIALDNRPELKRYEELRLAAKEAIKVAKAPLLPQVAVTGSSVGTFAKIQNASAQTQQTPFSTSGGASATAVSGASSLPVASSGSSGGRHDAGRSLFLIGVDMQWTLGGLGLTSAAKVQAARAEARRRQLEFSRSLNDVYKEVRDSYLNSITAENLIIETTDTVNSSKEQLRVAKDRLENGVGTNLDVINAQRDYTAAIIDKANAIIQFNTAQAQLLRDIGKISVQTLVASTPLNSKSLQ
ncbi:MAG: TolC family protein [Candidatus Obscuribacterales bacterium]|nr:TolC family protein [Candidatus Obscuribacterales bacterium]